MQSLSVEQLIGDLDADLPRTEELQPSAVLSALLKLWFRQVYARQASAEKLDQEPLVERELHELAGSLRTSAERRSSPPPPTPSETAVLREYEEEWKPHRRVDVSILFCRSTPARRSREDCGWMQDVGARLASGSATLEDLIEEARGKSGPASGTYRDLDTKQLSDGLADLILHHPVGETSRPFATLHGVFRVLVHKRGEEPVVSLDRARGVIEQQLLRAALQQQLAAVAEKLAEKPGASRPLGERRPGESPDLAPWDEAASAEHPEGWDSRSRWLLADEAFLRHDAVQPPDSELARRFGDSAQDFDAFRLSWFSLPSAARKTQLARVGAVLEQLTADQVPKSGPTVHTAARTLAEWKQEMPEVYEAVQGATPSSTWRGPIALPYPETSTRERRVRDLPAVVFVRVEDVLPASQSAVRRALRERFRNWIGGGNENFLSAMSEPWQLRVDEAALARLTQRLAAP